MGTRKRKEIKEYKVDEKTRTVFVYAKTLSELAEKKIKMYKEMDYKIVLLDREKPKTRTSQRIGKNEMRRYLKGNINDKIYNQLIKKLDSKERFCDIRHWLKEQLLDYAKNNKTDYVPANTIIQVAMANENTTAKENAIEYKKNNIISPTANQEEKEEN